MMAIAPPNLEPPYDPVYDYLEVWKVTITWDGDEYETRYIPDIGYESPEMLSDFKREFISDTMRYVGYASPSHNQYFVYSVMSKDEVLKQYWEEGCKDTFALVFNVHCYRCDEKPYKVKYHKKDIIDWLKDNQQRWLKIEVMSFWKIPKKEQEEIRSFIDEERAIEDYINRGGEL